MCNGREDAIRLLLKHQVRCAVRCSYYSLLAAHYSLLTAHHALLTTRYSLLATHYSLLTTHYSPLATHHSLLSTQANPSLGDKDGDTPLHLASALGMPHVVEILLTGGASLSQVSP